MKNLKPYWAFVLGSLILMGLFQGCKNDPVIPDNPYTEVDYGTPDPPPPPPDPNSIVGIHQNILVAKCNNPGCHDGTFEPDFRTVQSAWSTLVYHDIVKNTSDSSYHYRVVPGDTGSSMLMRRLTVEDPALQRMPATGDYLTDAEMNNVVTWINNGALDMFGNPGTAPNDEPRVLYYIGLDISDSIISENRVDSIFYNPFIVQKNSVLKLAWLIEDDSTALPDMLVNTTRFSTDPNDFSNAQSVAAFWLPFVDVWVTQINTSMFNPGETIYFRHYVNDGNHSFDTEFPRDDSAEPYKTFFAFYIEP